MKRLVIVAGSAVVLGLTACGGGGSTTSTSPSAEASSSQIAPADLQTYTSDQFGYSFQYGKPFEINSDAKLDAQTDKGAAETTAVFDTSGSQVDGQYRDAFMVSVYPLNATIDESNIDQVATELEQNVLPQLQKSSDNLQYGDLTSTDVNGVPGYQVDATFDVGSTPMKTTLYFLFDGSTEYQLLTQATADNWDALQPDFEQMVNSFTVSPAGASPAAS